MKILQNRPKCRCTRGFTLVEILVASVIGTFVALVALGTLRSVSVSADIVDSVIDSASSIRFISDMLAADLTNLYRDEKIQNTRLTGRVEETENESTTILNFFTVARTKARFAEPEGDVYEVEYYIQKSEEETSFARRLCPNPDQSRQNIIDAKGVLTVIADDIDIFEVRFFDGEQWNTEWPEDMEYLPDLLEVTIAAKQKGREKIVANSFIVNFARCSITRAESAEESEENRNTNNPLNESDEQNEN